MSNKIILYDPANRDNKCWSYNPWKARIALNFKNLPYKTEWLEYPDLATTLRSHGVPPNPPSINPRAEYSSPTVRLPDGRFTMDSAKIARELEMLQPSPPLHLDNPVVGRVQAAVDKLVPALAPIAIPRVPEMILNAVSRGYFDDARFMRRFGMTLEELQTGPLAGEGAWRNAREGMEEVRGLLGENGAGPFVLGEEASYADFILAGVWMFGLRLDEGGDLYGRLMEFDERFREHHRACQPWLERDD